MKRDDLTKEIIKAAESEDNGYFEYAHIIATRLPKKLRDSLEQLVNGPVWDGDVISKAHRDELIYLGLALRVCYKGNQGFTGATYLAYSVNKVRGKIESGEVG